MGLPEAAFTSIQPGFDATTLMVVVSAGVATVLSNTVDEARSALDVVDDELVRN
jgi:hypothetical protein